MARSKQEEPVVEQKPESVLKIRTIMWKDHNSFDDWSTKENYKPSAIVVQSIGYVVYEDDEIVSLANSYTEDDGFCCIINILKVCIVSDISIS